MQAVQVVANRPFSKDVCSYDNMCSRFALCCTPQLLQARQNNSNSTKISSDLVPTAFETTYC